MSKTPTSWLFGGGAWLYAPLLKLLFPGGERRARRLALDKIAATRPRRMLELGVGSGRNLPYYPPESLCVGVDNSEAMLARARRRLARLGTGNTELRRADAANLPFPANTFDAALLFLFCSQSVPHAEVFAELDRVVRPRGTLVIVDHVPAAVRLCSGRPECIERAAGRLGRRLEAVLDVVLRPLRLTVRADVRSLVSRAGWRVREAVPCPGTLSFIQILTVETGR